MKLQCGGLLGLDQAIQGREVAVVNNVAGSLGTAIAQFGSLEALPYAELIQSIRIYEARPRR